MTNSDQMRPQMRPALRRSALLMAALAGLLAPQAVSAQQQPAAPGSWAPATVSKAPAGTTATTLDAKQTATLQEVSKFFNDLKQLKGNFNQTNADGKVLRGKFMIKQPGRFRFDYGSGSKMVIVSDGKMLAVQDHDLKTDSQWELDRTPFRLLLRKDVDLARDAHILDIQDVDDLVILSLRDKDPDTVGRIKLFLVKKPAMELKEWVTTDPQGIDTRVEISELNRTDEVNNDLFKTTAPAQFLAPKQN